jgi:hypothetical protein
MKCKEHKHWVIAREGQADSKSVDTGLIPVSPVNTFSVLGLKEHKEIAMQ